MKFNKKMNKIISFVLAIVMILSAFAPAFTGTVHADALIATDFYDVTTSIPSGSVEYLNSGQIVDNPETGTDLDNFKIDLNFGTIDSAIDGDILNIKDQSIQIPIVINLEYTGDTPYNAETITMELIHNLNNLKRNNYQTLVSDVGAELVGSNSGRGDWYYTIANKEVKTETITFTNKSDIAGAFTSSIEVIVKMPELRYIVNGFTGIIDLTLSVENLEGEKISKTLNVNTLTTHDEFSLTSIIPYEYAFTSYGTTDNPGFALGYDLSKYYIMRVDFKSSAIMKNRGGDYYRSVELPDGVEYISGFKLSDHYYLEQLYGYTSYPSMIIAVSKDKYQAGDKFTIKWNANAVFLDTEETWEDYLEKEIEVVPTKITYKTGLAQVTKANMRLHQYTVNDDNGKDFEWLFGISVNSAALNAISNNESEEVIRSVIPIKTVVEDCETFAALEENFYRDLKPEEFYLKYLDFDVLQSRNFAWGSDNEITLKVYVKKDMDDEYVFIKEFSYADVTGPTYRVDINETQMYRYFKIEINGRMIDKYNNNNNTRQNVFKNFRAGYHIQIDPETEPHLNSEVYDMQVKNLVKMEEHFADGNTLKANNYGIIYFLPVKATPDAVESTSRVSSYSVLNSRIYFTITSNFRHKIQVDNEDVLDFGGTELNGEITIPSGFEFDVQDVKDLGFKFTQDYYDKAYVYDKENNLRMSATEANKILDKIIDYQKSTYNIVFNEDGTKTLKAKFILNDNYCTVFDVAYEGSYERYYSDFTIYPQIYMDFDTYSGLLYAGKLPSTLPIVNKTYKSEQKEFKNITWTINSDSFVKNFSLPSLAGSTFEGVEKFVNTGNGYSKDLQIVKADGSYSYKLRLAGGQALLDHIVFYDNLEEAYGENEYWKGTFVGLDTSLIDAYFKGENYTYTVYYSENKSQKFDLTDSGWIKAENWTKELSAVKSIAVDLGPDFRLPTKSMVYIIVNMKAPSSANIGEIAYNSYAADYKAYDVATGILMEDIKALPSNITEVMLNNPIDITINKIWSGSEPVSDSITVSLMANDTEYDTAILNKANNWTYTFKGLDSVTANGSFIAYSVAEINEFQRFETTYDSNIDEDKNITFTITNTRIPDDTYNISKEWKSVGSEPIILGLVNDNNLSLSDQLAMRAGKTITITATGEDLEPQVLELIADNEGLIEIPEEYAGYTNFNFSLKYNKKQYEYSYIVEYSLPEIPDIITLNTTDSKLPTVTLTKENNWQAVYKFEDYNVSFTEQDVKGWNGNNFENGLAITFDKNFKTHSYNYGSLYIYYKYNNKIYRSDAYYGTSLAGQTIEIPSTEFWIYFFAGSQNNNFYGFKVEDIQNINVTTILGSSNYNLPTTATPIELKWYEYPETEHNPYKTGTIAWHYKLDTDIQVEKLGEYNYDVKIINTAKTTPIIVSSDIEVKTYTYNFEKEWKVEGKEDSATIGLIESSVLSLEEQKALIAGKTLNITASGDNLESIVFEVTADENGNIVIPSQYVNYSDFNFSVKDNVKIYNFKYKLAFKDPEIPEEIKLTSSEGDTVVLSKENDWKHTSVMYNDNVVFLEEDLDTWSTGTIPTLNGLAITFNENCRTQNSSTAHMYIYYNYNGKNYRSSKYYGVSLAGKTIEIPSTEFWIYWYGNPSASTSYLNNYGFSIDKIENKTVTTALGSYNYTLPTTVTPIELEWYEYPETTHNPHNATGDIIWHYSLSKINDNISVTQVNDNTYNVKVINTGKQVATILSSDIEIQKIDFNINKDWHIVDIGSIILGYNTSSGLAADEYEAIIAGKTLSITAKGEGLNNKTFDVIATAEGLISIPDEYKGYTDFNFEAEYNNKVYQFNYKVSRTEPTIPDNITLIPSVKGYDINGNEINEITLTKENNWTATYKFEDTSVTFTEKEMSDWTGKINVIKNDDTYTVFVVNTGVYSYVSDVNLSYKQFNYNFEKEWNYKDSDFILGYLESSGLTLDKYKSIMSGKTLSITATGEGLKEITFEIKVDSVGNIVVPAEYANYTTFNFFVIDDTTYQFTYNISKSEPELPEQIKLTSSNGDTIIIKKSDNWTAEFVSEVMNLQFTEVYKNTDFEAVVSTEKVDNAFNVKAINTGRYVYTSSVIVETNEDIIITKEWIIPEDFIKFNIKDVLGYEGNYDKLEILKEDTVLETITKSTESGLLVSTNKYPITESYIAKIYMTDGSTRTATINEHKFELVPVEVEVFNGETSLGIFELNKNNNWQVTVSVPADADIAIKEITTGNWTYEVIDTVVKNTVNQEIKVTDIILPTQSEIIDTGNAALSTYVLSIFLVGLSGLAASLLLLRKKKTDN